MPDPIEEWHVLREQTDVLLQQTVEVQSRLGPAVASDATGQVTVKVDVDGLLESVQVGFTWDQSLTKDELGPRSPRSSVALIVAHGVATGEAVSIIGLPAVPPMLATAYGACIVLLIGAITNLNNAASSSNAVFLQVAAETADYGSANWPPAVISAT